MMGEVIGTEEFSEVVKRFAESRARDRARSARWDLDIAVFYFSVMFLVIILVYLNIVIEIVAPVAIAGLVVGWLMGWKKGRQKFQGFYDSICDCAVVCNFYGFKESIVVWASVGYGIDVICNVDYVEVQAVGGVKFQGIYDSVGAANYGKASAFFFSRFGTKQRPRYAKR